MTLVLGIDPGRTGGFALIEDEMLKDHGELSLHPDRIGYDVLFRYSARVDVVAYETQHTLPSFRPKKNGAGSFALGGSKTNWLRGFSTGFLMAWSSAFRVPRVMPLSPRRWQRTMLDGVAGTTTKKQSVRAAECLFPDAVLKTKRGRVLDGVADAINIAMYAQRIIISER